MTFPVHHNHEPRSGWTPGYAAWTGGEKAGVDTSGGVRLFNSDLGRACENPETLTVAATLASTGGCALFRCSLSSSTSAGATATDVFQPAPGSVGCLPHGAAGVRRAAA